MSNGVRHFISVDDFSLSDYAAVFEDTAAIKKGWGRSNVPQPTGRMVSLFFGQQSSRTSMSFQKAAVMSGHQTSALFAEMSAVTRGENFEDVMRMAGLGSDLIVVRHSQSDSRLRHVADHIYPMHAELSHVSIINAGSQGEHPTQALMDLFTIWEAFGRYDVKIAFYGDLRHSYVATSLMKLMSRFGAHIFCIAGDRDMEVQEPLLNEVTARSGSHPIIKPVLEPFLGDIDVLYVTRLLKESSFDDVHHRFGGQFTPYRVQPEWLKKMRDDAIILHPLPRFDELPTDIDRDKRARYVTQAHNGIFSRMALMRYCLNSVSS